MVGCVGNCPAVHQALLSFSAVLSSRESAGSVVVVVLVERWRAGNL